MAFRLCILEHLMMNRRLFTSWIHIYGKMAIKMICQKIDCIMRFIFQMQEKLLLKNGKRLSGIR